MAEHAQGRSNVNEAQADTDPERMDAATERAIRAFLYKEAELLDNREFEQWLQLWTEDAVYRMPVRVTRDRRDSVGEFLDDFAHFDETREMLEMRVRRLGTHAAWAEEPPSRTRHFVSNVRVSRSATGPEYLVRANLLLYRNRGDSPHHDLLSAERHDRLVMEAGGWRIRERVIYLDQATLGTLNLSIFL